MRLMTTFDSGGKLYWRQDQTPSEYRCIRAGGDERREIEQIPDCELENAIVEVLTLEVGLPRDDLIRVSSKLLGFSRLGANLTDVSATRYRGLPDGERSRLTNTAAVLSQTKICNDADLSRR